MANAIKPPRVLFLVSCVILFALSSTLYFTRSQLPPSIPILTRGQPTIGYSKARVQVVVFEEPKCSHCRDFNNEIFPAIKKEFVDTNKIRYTLIPVSFLPGSMPAAIATLCVYYENPLYPNDELFFKYFDHIYRYQSKRVTDWATPEKLVEFAQATSPAIQLDRLKEGIERETYRVQIEQNTNYGSQIMGGAITTPTVFVNGLRLQEISLESLRKLIEEVLEHEGIY
jgi:protein-disulfide isomerase